MEKTLKVLAIKNGTVIDHIPAGKALRIINILKLQNFENVITIGKNLPSKTHGKKDIIKIENLELNSDQVNQVALIAPLAKINIIKNYQVIKKFKVAVPEVLVDIVTCPNPKCVTNKEQGGTKFLTVFKKNKFQLKCHHCERLFSQEEIYDYLA
jgi:aspartate carbamoyltransferase regulatory subunit